MTPAKANIIADNAHDQPSPCPVTNYRGRFAPSPTGLLHAGSLIAAVASYLDAKSNGGQWLLRMEDLDPPREIPGAADAILESLYAHGLQWDEEPMWQSHRHPDYQCIIDSLLERGHAYYCTCSRSELRASGGVYPGHCRGSHLQPNKESAIRLYVTDGSIQMEDGIQGIYSQNPATAFGDFVLRRKDLLYAYQLAVVADDAKQNITHIVRGSDLLESTPKQIYLQRLLGYKTPHYAHIPIIINSRGQKLSKQTFAKPLEFEKATDNLLAALTFLQQPLPPIKIRASVRDILEWSTEHWSLRSIPRALAVTEKN
ncbi:MAG: tRNA glutamyl-Q(34) synthetase GluQRS [Oceanicoccus sp.]